jgi:hypothetical protein
MRERCVPTTGGLGKSTLANKVYTEMKSMGVFGEDSSKYVAFDLGGSDRNDDAMVDEVHRWLEKQKGPVLLLLDNAQRQHQVDSIVNDTRIIDQSFVLVTSRRQDLVPQADLYEMPTMDAADELELFRWHSQGSSSSGVLKTLVLQV